MSPDRQPDRNDHQFLCLIPKGWVKIMVREEEPAVQDDEEEEEEEDEEDEEEETEEEEYTADGADITDTGNKNDDNGGDDSTEVKGFLVLQRRHADRSRFASLQY